MPTAVRIVGAIVVDWADLFGARVGSVRRITLEGVMKITRKIGRSQIVMGGLLGTGDVPVRLYGVRKNPLSDAYHYLVNAPWFVVLLAIAGAFGAANAFFALGYLATGGVANVRPGSFSNAFFFSIQTLSTIGYGAMWPRSNAANALVALEALTGGLGLALMTGLVFAKFSRPTARVRFSRVAVIADYQGRRSLMFRMANERDERIVQPQLYAVLLRAEPEADGGYFIRVHDLPLVRDRHAFLSLTWLVIHQIDEHSPLRDCTPDSCIRERVAIIVSLTGIDEGLSQTVHAHHTYSAADIRWNSRFVDVIQPGDGGWLVDYTQFDEVR
jgi:inward rectifier potassium channel